MSKKSNSEFELKCPLTKEQQQTIKKVADTIDKHKQIAKKINPLC